MKTATAILISLVVAAVIALATLSPPGDGAPLPIGDKELHALAFALLVLPVGWIRQGWWVALAVLAVIYGGAIELLQPLVSRSAEWADWGADAIGVALGLLPGQLRRRLLAG
jgi:VanZ family protein